MNKLVEREINNKIKQAIYPPKDKWSPGSSSIVRSTTNAQIEYKIDQSISLFKMIEEVQ